MTLRIPTGVLVEIHAHAIASYPEECCGLGTASMNEPDTIQHWHPCVNAQDRFHELDPGAYPRTSRNGYLISPQDLFRISRDATHRGEIIRLIVHSHCDAGVYFSEEDERCALVDGEPHYPLADQMVVAVTDGCVMEHGIFRWCRSAGFARCDVDE